MQNNKKALLIILTAIIVIAGGLVYYLFFSSFSSKGGVTSINIYENDNIDSVYARIERAAEPKQLVGFRILSSLSGYKSRIRSGHYEVDSTMSTFSLLRTMRNGMQTPIQLTVPSVRTLERLSGELGKHLMVDSAAIVSFVRDSAECQRLGFDTTTIACMFIPNTYEMYWNVPLKKLMERMKKEYNSFWTEKRRMKASEAGLSPNEVITLASIIDEETANNAEKPDIAGMYLNRLRVGMPLQADPTIKFALKQFQLRRIYQNLLSVNSPYNTYRNVGLPPGPIRIPSVAGIEAVLNHAEHDYYYMCAKEDFSGTHNFARTYSEHLANARKYTDALNKRGIQ